MLLITQPMWKVFFYISCIQFIKYKRSILLVCFFRNSFYCLVDE
nr:MAG TPA: hypothetical protein [Caudoviricetes sp.]